jgi:hypothetical protein
MTHSKYQKDWPYYEKKKKDNPQLYEKNRQEACDRILALEREWRHDPDWKPTLLNGAYGFELKVRKYIYDNE